MLVFHNLQGEYNRRSNCRQNTQIILYRTWYFRYLYGNKQHTFTHGGTNSEKKLENVLIAMHCNLRPPDAAPIHICFNYDTHAQFEVGQPVHCRFIAFSMLIRSFRCDLDL